MTVGAQPPVGVLVVDKPPGWTSHDVVARLRRAAGTRRVGHAGTLDPMATGVLVLGIGWATRLLTHVVGVDKSYDATIRLGQATVTDDAEGEVTSGAHAAGLTVEEVDRAVARLRGPIWQVPSSVSAIKVDGKRSYARVRGGETVDLPARPVAISRFEILARRSEGPLVDLDVRVDCSSGTYVRALARDLGVAVGTGGHLTVLRRTRVGPFTLAAARPMDDLTGSNGLPTDSVMSLADAARLLMNTVELDEAGAASFRHGRVVRLAGTECGDNDGAGTAADAAADTAALAVLDPAGELLGFGARAAGELRPTAVIPS